MDRETLIARIEKRKNRIAYVERRIANGVGFGALRRRFEDDLRRHREVLASLRRRLAKLDD